MADPTSLREQFDEAFWVGEWRVEPMRNCVRHRDADEEIQLEPKVMEVLLCMARRPGKTVTKSHFKETVWTDAVVTDDVLSRCISELRTTFDDAPEDPSYIETIRKTGYRLIAPVRNAPDPLPAETSVPSPQWPAAESLRQRSSEIATALRRRLRWLVAATRDAGILRSRRQRLFGAGLVAALLAVGIALWVSGDPPEQNEGPRPARPFTSFGGEEFSPAFSPREHQLAFAWRQPDSLDQNIYLTQRGAEQPLRLTGDSTLDRSPTWSPDGRFLAYVERSGQAHRVATVPSIGGRPSQVLSLPRRRIQSIAWMPDTSRRALVVSAQRRPHQALSLFLQYVDADSTAALTTPPLWSIGDRDPVFSPDGSQIAFVRSTIRGVGNLYIMPTSGGPPTQLTNAPTNIDGVTWSEDGTHLLYAAQHSGVSGLWRVHADGEGDPVLVRSASEGTLFSDPTLSSQSDRLAYTQKSSELDLWMLSRPNQYQEFTAKPLISSSREDTQPSISPDGKRIAYVSERSGTQEVWTARADGSAQDRLTSLGGPSVRSVTWSPTGNQLCFVARRDGQADLYLTSASGGPSTRLTSRSAQDLIPRWSPDGRWLYFASNRTGGWEIWRTRARADSQRVQRVTTGGAVAAQESATGSTLYFVRPDTTGIWAVPLDTTALPLSTTPPSAGDDASGAAGDKDSAASSPRQVVASFFPRERRNWWVGTNGMHFVHQRSKRAVLAYYDFSSRRILPLYEFPDWRPVQSLAVGPRGDWFVYTHVVRRESDVMLVENFP